MQITFNMLIVGMTACDRTSYLLNMLEKDYKNYFDYIILICPMFEWNITYQEWKYIRDNDFIVIQCDQTQVDTTLKCVTEIYKGTNSLVILDDYASSQDVKNRVSELTRLAFCARHFNIAMIIITQQLTSISKMYHENISKLVTFYNPVDDYLYGLTKAERE